MYDGDWAAIQAEYVSGNMSYDVLAAKYGVSRKRLRERGAAEGWVQLRAEFRAKICQKAMKKAEERQADRLVRLMTASDNVDEAIVRLSGKIASLSQAKTAAEALLKAIQAKRELYGLPTEAEQEQLALVRAKRKQLERELESGDTPDEVIIRIEGGEEYGR